MSDIPSSKLNYIEGEADVYAETVARTGKPLASFDISFDDEPGNWETVKKLGESVKQKATDYGIKCFVRNFRQEYKDNKDGHVYTTPAVDFCYYEDEKILSEYLSIVTKETRSMEDHKNLGKIFGYTEEIINEFLKRQIR